MLRISGRHVRQFGLQTTTLLLLASMTAYAQSLGEVARESREKKAEAPTSTPPKVITNADLPKDAQEAQETDTSIKPQAAFPGKIGAGRTKATSAPDPRAAEQWRTQILAQKRSVATLEKRLARYQASLSYGDASAIARGEILTRNQALEQERLAQVHDQLEEQRAKLVEMQDEARRAGMYPKVYDP